jgi:hypothetical protein
MCGVPGPAARPVRHRKSFPASSAPGRRRRRPAPITAPGKCPGADRFRCREQLRHRRDGPSETGLPMPGAYGPNSKSSSPVSGPATGGGSTSVGMRTRRVIARVMELPGSGRKRDGQGRAALRRPGASRLHRPGSMQPSQSVGRESTRQPPPDARVAADGSRVDSSRRSGGLGWRLVGRRV